MLYLGLDVHELSTMIYWYDDDSGESCPRTQYSRYDKAA